MDEQKFELMPIDRLRIAEAGIILMQDQHVELQVQMARATEMMQQMADIVDRLERRIKRLEEKLGDANSGG